MTDHEIWILPSSICCLVLCHRKLTVELIDITCQSTRPFGVKLVNFIFYLSEHKSHGSSTLETSVSMISHVYFWWIGRHLLWNWSNGQLSFYQRNGFQYYRLDAISHFLFYATKHERYPQTTKQFMKIGKCQIYSTSLHDFNVHFKSLQIILVFDINNWTVITCFVNKMQTNFEQLKCHVQHLLIRLQLLWFVKILVYV